MLKFAAASVIALALASAAAAQTPGSITDRPLVVATGSGQATRVPDFLRVGFTVRGEGATPTEALAAVERQRGQIEAGMRGLKGARGLELISTGVNSEDVRPAACTPRDSYPRAQLSTGDCAVIGVIASMAMEVKVSPAARAGDVASLAVQLGAKGVGLRGSGFVDPQALQRDAAASAMEDARRQADQMARAAGGRLGPVLRIQDAATSYSSPEVGFNVPPPPVEEPVVSGTRAMLAVPLTFTPQPVTRNARVTVTFALESGAAPAR